MLEVATACHLPQSLFKHSPAPAKFCAITDTAAAVQHDRFLDSTLSSLPYSFTQSIPYTIIAQS